ncbi:metal-dependent hydrolase family protein [Lacrimispora sp.]|uniref:metal-dependent hydrolase family protein n=1 Tax=Lacrimispora sp. TaxID=2719234 RepID=UPI0028B1D212|nr:amidohydrolase family protein [Lacrimispora sp.]
MARLIFKNINIFDGINNEWKKNKTVLVDEGKIIVIKDACEKEDPIDGLVYDCNGLTMMPGLIDSHANIVGLITAEQRYGITPKTIASSTLRGVMEGKNCIINGVTTIRVDTAGHHGTYALRDAFDAGSFIGPHMIMPGRAICTTCGHGWNFGNHIADGPWEIRKAVREEIMAGADWIKLMITGGAGTSTERMEDQQMCKEEIEAAIDEAHARGRKCFAHLTISKAINEAVDAGIDSVEHGILMDEPTAYHMAEMNTTLVPTLGVYRRLVDRGEKGLVPDYMYKKSMAVVEQHTQAFHFALKAGVNIVAGTDSGQDWFPLGFSLLKEMEIMNEEGLSNFETLKSATSNAADLLNLPNVGKIAEGYNADILIIQGNPLGNISEIRNMRYVLKDGEVVAGGGKKE